MTNSLSQDIYILGQTMADNLNTMGVDSADVDDGLTTLAGKILDVPISTESVSLSIDVPLNIVYGDDFNITGVLTDSNDDPIAEMTIQLLVGNSPVATSTTDSNGSVSFTRSPVTMGTHTFQLHFNGSGNYPATSSSTVSRNVDKETSVITLYTPADNSSIYSDESVSITGVLTDDDGNAINDASILIQKGGTTVTTLTTGNDGSFRATISGLTVGSHTLGFVFETTDYYTASSVTRTITVNTPTLTVSADNPILSYKDGDEATLYATYVSGTVSGKTVTFYKSSDDSVLGTGTTDASGVATCGTSYQSQGVGNVGFYAKCGSLYSDTYDVEDCWLHRDSVSSSDSFTLDSPTSFQITSNIQRNSSSSYIYYRPTTSASVTYDIGVLRSKGSLSIRRNSDNTLIADQNSSIVGTNTDVELFYSYNNGTHTETANGTTITATNEVCDFTTLAFYIENGSVSNLKVKPL